MPISLRPCIAVDGSGDVYVSGGLSDNVFEGTDTLVSGIEMPPAPRTMMIYTRVPCL